MCSKLSVTFSLITQLHVNIPIHVHKGTCIKRYLWTELVPGRYMYRDSEFKKGLSLLVIFGSQ